MSKRLRLVGYAVYHGLIGSSLLIGMLLDHSGEYEILYEIPAVLVVLLYVGRGFLCDWKLLKMNRGVHKMKGGIEI